MNDYQDCKLPWIQAVIQDWLGPVIYPVLVGDLLWKRHIDQLRSLPGSKVADEMMLGECLRETPGDVHAELMSFQWYCLNQISHQVKFPNKVKQTMLVHVQVRVPPSENPRSPASSAVITDASCESGTDVSTPKHYPT